MCDLMTASVWIGLRWSEDYGKVACYPRYFQHLLRSRAERRPPKIQRGSGHPRRAGALDVDGTGAYYRLRSSFGVGYAVRGRRQDNFAIAAGAR